MKRIYIKRDPKAFFSSPSNLSTTPPTSYMVVAVLAFLFGCVGTASIVLTIKVNSVETTTTAATHSAAAFAGGVTGLQPQQLSQPFLPGQSVRQEEGVDKTWSVQTALQNTRILVAIAAYDFSQIPHLEEVLDAYHDICTAGAEAVDVVIHATVAYPVTLIDLWNSRFNCEQFTVTVVLKPKSLRLHLVDCHRALFYEKINEYDLFIYTEDDIRVKPSTVATYLYETKRIERLLQGNVVYKPSDFNVGIVRYEYNYPPNVVIDDKTRHATVNVTRVYWEHSGFERPVVPNSVVPLTQDPLADWYASMRNHHQGMFLATRELLLAWKDRPNCEFDKARERPGRGAQPTEGTQRVWMSSRMLYGPQHCNVQQVIPKEKFGSMTVLHLPNKNYRRVGKYRNRTFADGTEEFVQPHASLLTAMELHLSIRKEWPLKPQKPYRGIRMIDEVDFSRDRTPVLERRMGEYEAYVDRGGVLSEYDMTRT